MSRINPDYLVTREGLRLIQNQHAALEAEAIQRREDVTVARAHGDLSENAEYDAARSRLLKTQAELTEIRSLLHHCVVAQIPPDTSVVRFGACVSLVDQTDKNYKFRIGSKIEARLDESQFLYFRAPLPALLIARKLGDTVELNDHKYTITGISYDSVTDATDTADHDYQSDDLSVNPQEATGAAQHN